MASPRCREALLVSGRVCYSLAFSRRGRAHGRLRCVLGKSRDSIDRRACAVEWARSR